MFPAGFSLDSAGSRCGLPAVGGEAEGVRNGTALCHGNNRAPEPLGGSGDRQRPQDTRGKAGPVGATAKHLLCVGRQPGAPGLMKKREDPALTKLKELKRAAADTPSYTVVAEAEGYRGMRRDADSRQARAPAVGWKLDEAGVDIPGENSKPKGSPQLRARRQIKTGPQVKDTLSGRLGG